MLNSNLLNSLILKLEFADFRVESFDLLINILLDSILRLLNLISISGGAAVALLGLFDHLFLDTSATWTVSTIIIVSKTSAEHKVIILRANNRLLVGLLIASFNISQVVATILIILIEFLFIIELIFWALLSLLLRRAIGISLHNVLSIVRILTFFAKRTLVMSGSSLGGIITLLIVVSIIFKLAEPIKGSFWGVVSCPSWTLSILRGQRSCGRLLFGLTSSIFADTSTCSSSSCQEFLGGRSSFDFVCAFRLVALMIRDRWSIIFESHHLRILSDRLRLIISLFRIVVSGWLFTADWFLGSLTFQSSAWQESRTSLQEGFLSSCTTSASDWASACGGSLFGGTALGDSMGVLAKLFF